MTTWNLNPSIIQMFIWYALLQDVPGGNVNILRGHSKQKVTCTCSILNGFRDRAISPYSCKIVDREIFPIVSNISIYCSSDKVGTVYLVQYILENSSININALFSSCEDMVFFLSECILTFLYAGDNIHYEIEQFVSCIHFCSVHSTLHPTSLKRI